jgi:hypothetical protein
VNKLPVSLWKRENRDQIPIRKETLHLKSIITGVKNQLEGLHSRFE